MGGFKKNLVGAAAFLGLGIALCGSAAVAATQIVTITGPATGNQPNGDLPLDLGINFTVHHAVTVESLGAFTNGTSPIEVKLFNSSGTALTSADITSAPATGDYSFSSLSTPLTLVPGTYQIEATYSSTSNTDYNPYESGGTNDVAFDTLGGALSFGGDYYNLNGSGSMATTYDSLSTGGYGAGTFTASAVPEPATWAMMLFGVGLIGAGMRMSRRKSLSALSPI